MNTVTVVTDIDHAPIPAFKGIERNAIETIHDPITVVRIPKGTLEGNTTIAVCAKTKDGKGVFIEMSFKCLIAAMAAFKGAEDRDKHDPGKN